MAGESDDEERPPHATEPRRARVEPHALTLVGGDVLPREWTDTRCRLPSVFDRIALDAVITSSVRASVMRLVAVGTDLGSSAAAVQVAKAVPGVWATVGVHGSCLAMEPVPAGTLADDLEPLLLEDGVVAVTAAIARDGAAPGPQHELLAAHVSFAKTYDLVLVLECGDAFGTTLDVVIDEGLPERIVVHAFDGSIDDARRSLDLGMYLSFNHAPASDAAGYCPIERLLIETDSPCPRAAGPASLPSIGRAIALARSADPTDVARWTWHNARSLFRLR